MSDISSLVSEDSRKPIERLRRCKLWKIANAYGITYPPAASKDVMIPILEGNGIDVTQPLPDDSKNIWNRVVVENESGHHHVELYPELPEHATANKNIDYDSVIESNAVDYSLMSRPDLMKACKAQGIKTIPKDTKKSLIGKIEAA